MSEPSRSSAESASVSTSKSRLVTPEASVRVFAPRSSASTKAPTWLTVRPIDNSACASPVTLMVYAAVAPSVSAALGPVMLTSGVSSSSVMLKLTDDSSLSNWTPPSRFVPALTLLIAESIAMLMVSFASSSVSDVADTMSVAVVALSVAPPVKVTVGGLLVRSVLPRLL